MGDAAEASGDQVSDALREEIKRLKSVLEKEKAATKAVKTRALKLEKATKTLDPKKTIANVTEDATGKPKRMVRRGHSRTRSGGLKNELTAISEGQDSNNTSGNLELEFARMGHQRTSALVDAAYVVADNLRTSKFRARDGPRRMPLHEACARIQALEEELEKTKQRRVELQEQCKKDILALNELHSHIQDLEAILAEEEGADGVDKISGFSKARRLLEKCSDYRSKIDEIWKQPEVNRQKQTQARDEHNKFIRELADHLKRKVFKKGEYIVRQGEDGDCMYVLAVGSARVELPGGKHVEKLLREGDFLGEIALMTDCKRTTSVVAHTDVIAFVFTREDCEGVLSKYPDKEAEFRAVGNARLKRDAEYNAATPAERKKMKQEPIPMPTWISETVARKWVDDSRDILDDHPKNKKNEPKRADEEEENEV